MAKTIGKDIEHRRREFLRGLSMGVLLVAVPLLFNVYLGLTAAILVYIFRKEVEERTRKLS